MQMRKQKQVIEELIEWGQNENQIRTLILFGSRANPNAFTDCLSDYDIFIVVEDAVGFGENDSWRYRFGGIIAMYEEEPVQDKDGCISYPKLVLYEDGVRIDFCISNKKSFIINPEETFDIGYQVLLDKDNLTKDLPEPTHQLFKIKKPTEVAYHKEIKDFWFDIVYVAKALWRDELYFAKFMSDSMIRFNYLQKMIEWYIAAQHDWDVNTNKKGRWFKRYIDSETWSEIERTYAGPGLEDNWRALFNIAALFRKLAISVGKDLGYDYLHELDKKVSGYLDKIQTLDKKTS